MSLEDFIQNLTVDGQPFADAFAPVSSLYDDDPWYWLAILTSEGNSQLVYQDPVSGQEMNISAAAIFESPVKINLNGQNARLNSNHHFLFDSDGFSKNTRGIIQTTGGLNPHEAWLVADKAGNGIIKQQIVDGEDVFGDHLGKYPSGYEELAKLFHHELKKDETGKRYIPIRKLAWWEQLMVWFKRFFGMDKQAFASYDLAFLTRDNRILPVSRYLDRIYVDYWDVSELDAKKRNWIRQRSTVRYVNGKSAESVDQWFQSGLRIQLTPVEKTGPIKKAEP